jgi:SAM-dependent methyltransferase
MGLAPYRCRARLPLIRAGDTGNSFYRHLVAPTALQLLSLTSGERVLELACGNGIFSRAMAACGAHVVATDFSAAMVARARAHGGGDIKFLELDITDAEELLAFCEVHGDFDAVIVNVSYGRGPIVAGRCAEATYARRWRSWTSLLSYRCRRRYRGC